MLAGNRLSLPRNALNCRRAENGAKRYIAAIRFLGSWENRLPPKDRFTSITGDELYRRLAMGEPVVVLDVRTDGEFERQHIPGSLLIPLQSLPARIADVPNSGVPIGGYEHLA